MNNLKTIFSEIFNSKAIKESCRFNEKRKERYNITLIEEQNKGKKDTLEEVIISGFDEIYFAIKFDECFFLHRGKDNDLTHSLLIAENIRKTCDYIIWAKFQGCNIVLLIELKSLNPENVTAKFKSSTAFIMFLNSILEQYYSINTIHEFQLIPLLITTQIGKGKPTNNDNIFYHKKLGTNKIYNIQSDFEQILKL